MSGALQSGDPLPVALSVRKGDAHYDSDLLGKPIQVLLDGQPVALAIAYDRLKGEVVRHIPDAQGRPVRGADRSPLTETLTGAVSARWVDPASGTAEIRQ